MIGLKVLKRRRAVPVELALQFIDVPVSNVSDCMSRLFAGRARLRPMHSGIPMSGPALTVRTRPGDNLMIHKALQMAALGDIIVVDAGGDLTNAVIGDLLVGIAIQRGLGGFVINGAIRDARAVREGNFLSLLQGSLIVAHTRMGLVKSMCRSRLMEWLSSQAI